MWSFTVGPTNVITLHDACRVLRKLDKAKTATYKITIQATSAKTGLKSSSVLTIAFTVQPPALGKGQSKKKKSLVAVSLNAPAPSTLPNMWHTFIFTCLRPRVRAARENDLARTAIKTFVQ